MMSFWVVPCSARLGDALLLGRDDVEREQPRGRRVDRHRRVHLVERDAVQQRRHVARGGRPARRPCRPRRARARGRSRSRSASAGRTLRRARSGPWPGCAGRARWTWRPWSAPRTSASSTAGPARAAGASCPNCIDSRVNGHRPGSIDRGRVQSHAGDRCAAQRAGEGHLLLGGRRGPDRPRARASREDTLLAELGEGFEPRAILLTHIHFDHAGATGSLVRRWPTCRSTCTSAARRTWPIPPSCSPRRRAAVRRRRRAAGAVGRVRSRCPRRTCACSPAARPSSGRSGSAYTPGHASHHVCLLPRATAARRSSATSAAPASRRTTSPSHRRRRRTSTSPRGRRRSRRSAPGGRPARHHALRRRAGRAAARRGAGGPGRPGRSSRSTDEAGFVAAMDERIRAACGEDAPAMIRPRRWTSSTWGWPAGARSSRPRPSPWALPPTDGPAVAVAVAVAVTAAGDHEVGPGVEDRT